MDIFRNLFEELAPEDNIEKIKKEILKLKTPTAKKTSNYVLYDEDSIKYYKEKGEPGTVDHETERYVFRLGGGLNGCGTWSNYFKDLSVIFKELEENTGWAPVATDFSLDTIDDVFDVEITLFNPKDHDELNDKLNEDLIFIDKNNAKSKLYGLRKQIETTQDDSVKESLLNLFNLYLYQIKSLMFDYKVDFSEDEWQENHKFMTDQLEGKSDQLDEDIEKHETLNPKLFNEDEKLKDEVLDKINLIVEYFLSDLEEDGIKIDVEDIILVGSNVSYNYTKDSDLDIHIIANTDDLDCPDDLYPLLYGAYKSLFNRKMDISFYGIPVEVYVETDDTPLRSNGIYSVKDNDWIVHPVQAKIPDIDFDQVEELVKPYENRYKEILENPSVEEIEQLITDIYEERKKGMSDENGEYSLENLCFKEFRNRGYLDKLKDLKNEVLSKELSLENLEN